MDASRHESQAGFESFFLAFYLVVRIRTDPGIGPLPSITPQSSTTCGQKNNGNLLAAQDPEPEY